MNKKTVKLSKDLLDLANNLPDLETTVLATRQPNMLISNGDIFKSNAQALVNPVNCVGVMGGGLAYAFKKRYPSMYEEYRALCEDRTLRPGKVFGHRWGQKIIVSFPTKGHYKNDSKIEYIESGLDSLMNLISSMKIDSIAVPALGCGLGNLDWDDVFPIIKNRLDQTHLEFYEVFPPQ